MGTTDIAKLLLGALDLAVTGALAIDRYNQLRAIVQPILDQNREPTPEEWAALRSMDIDLDARLDAAARVIGDP